MNKVDIFKAQKTVLVGERAKVGIDLEVLTNNPQSIPEHVQFQAEVDKLIGQLAEINDKIKIVDFLIQQEDNK